MKEFILSTEDALKPNSKEWLTVLSDGIAIQEKTPILLNNGVEQIIGEFVNISVINGQLIGIAKFDDSDGVSIGIQVYESFINDEGIFVISKSELIEASLTDNPSNK